MLILFLVLFWFSTLCEHWFSHVSRRENRMISSNPKKVWFWIWTTNTDKHCKGPHLLQRGFTQSCKNRSLLENLTSLWGDFTFPLLEFHYLAAPFLFLGLLPHFPGAYPLLAFQEILSRGFSFFFCVCVCVWKCLYRIDSLGVYRI